MTAGPPDGRLYLGWQYATPYADPGPPPRRPAPPDRAEVSGGWLAAQRREEDLINRPVKLAAWAALAAAAVLSSCAAAGWLPLPAVLAALAVCLIVVAFGGLAIWQGERALRARIADERVRVARLRADAEARLFASQAEHASRASQWQRQRLAFENQKRWYALPLPAGIDRVDVAGGTLSGWSAVLTMAAAHRLAAGGEVTVVDLSGGAVGADLVGLAAAAGPGTAPAVWVLPHDLPRLGLAAALSPGELVEVLALSANAAEDRSGREAALDAAILDRVIGALYPEGSDAGGISLARVTAALRALAQVGDPRGDIAAGLLTEREVVAVTALYGQGASDRVILERALAMEAHLRVLATAGRDPVPPPGGRLRVLGLDGRTGAVPATVLGSFVVGALTSTLGQAGRDGSGHPEAGYREAGHPETAYPGTAGQRPWRHTLFLLGADRLRDDVLDRLTDACETARCGLVLAYRTVPPRVRQRIGRGNAAVAFMRLGNAEEAKAASEQIGTAHRFVLSQLTETVGTSVTDTTGTSYTSTVGDSASLATATSDSDSVSRGGGSSRSTAGGALPFGVGQTSHSTEAGTSRSTSESVSLTGGISTSTAWGVSTSRAAGDSESLARSLQRSREFLVEAAELQRLPATAVIVTYAGPAGREAVLADANPAIGALTVATMTPLAEAAATLPPAPPDPPDPRAPRATSPRAAPNVGPPAPRLDWRHPRGTAELTGVSPPAARRGLRRAGDRIASAEMDANTHHRPRLPMRAKLAATVGGAAATVSRLAGRDGSVIGGIIGLRLEPDLLSLLAADRQVVLVTGTNGKTTTTRLIGAALAPLGQPIASNVYGANMEAGLTSALSKSPDAPIAVLETDEKYIPAMVKATNPKVVVLLNLSRDQMDRAAEIWLLARRWREALASAPGCRVVANADDPLVAWAASAARQVTWVAAGQRWREDSWCCPNCGSHLQRDGDDWSCHECGGRRPPVSWMLYGEQVIDPSGRYTQLDLALPGRANRSNAVVALAVAEAFGVHVAHALGELRAVTSVAGRYTQVRRRGCELRLLLAKNPAGWLEALDVLAPAPAPVLLAVNAQGPDGRDTSWLWDVDYRRLRGRTVLVGGERKLDLAVRLEADEVRFGMVSDIDEAIDAARSPSLEVLANYTAFQQYRAVLGRTE